MVAEESESHFRKVTNAIRLRQKKEFLEKREVNLNDMAWSICETGSWAGLHALFVRLPYCDAHTNSHKPIALDTLQHYSRLAESRLAVITGGEPGAHSHTPAVVRTLTSEGFTIAMETEGQVPPIQGINYLICAPKRHHSWEIDPAVWIRASEFRYTVDDEFDFSLLDRHNEMLAVRKQPIGLFLIPDPTNLAAAVDRITHYLGENPKWRLSVPLTSIH